MNVYKLEWKSLFRGFLLWTLIVCGLLVLFMAFYPSMKNEAMKELVGVKLNAMPPAVLKAFGISSLPDFTNITYYFSYVVQYMDITAAVYAAMLGASSLIREESDGTIEYLYAQPVTRKTVVLQKMLANLSVYALFVMAMGAVTAVLYAAMKPEGSDLAALLADVKIIYAGMFFMGAVFLAVGFLASALLRSAKQAVSFSLGIVFSTFILGIAAVVVKQLEFFKYFSPINYVKPEELVKSGFQAEYVWIGLAVTAVCTAATFILYQRKDLKV
jgi:ABC-2 type transport system permease protein